MKEIDILTACRHGDIWTFRYLYYLPGFKFSDTYYWGALVESQYTLLEWFHRGGLVPSEADTPILINLVEQRNKRALEWLDKKNIKLNITPELTAYASLNGYVFYLEVLSQHPSFCFDEKHI